MSIVIDGTGTISGVSATGISTAQTVTSVANITTGTLAVANGGTGVTSAGTSGNVLTSNGTAWASTAPAASGLGVGQSWTDVSGSRSLGTTYTNSTGKPIAVSWTSTAGYNPAVTVSGVTVVTSVAYLVSAFFIVPNGATYSISSSSSYVWCELR